MNIAALSSEAAQALFESGYVIRATAAVAASSNAANSDHIYAEFGKLWAQTRRGLDALCSRHRRTYPVKGGRSARTSRIA